MSDELRDRIAAAIESEEEYPHARGYVAHAQAIIDDLGLTVTSVHQEHKAGSAVELGETEDEYNERVRPKTIHRLVGRWEKQ